MRTRPLGHTEIEISTIGLGGMPMSLAGRPSQEQSIRTIHAALDAGMTFIDTADVYCLDDDDIGHNEALIRAALKSWTGPRPLVATKGGLRRPGGDWTVDAHPKRLKQACEHSLRSLGVECIDLYQLHAVDDEVPLEDSVGALVELQQAGKVQHLGLSNVEVSHIERARALCSIESVQNRCNVFERTSFHNGVVEHCTRHGITFLPHSPVGGHRDHGRTPQDPTLLGIARRHGVTPYRVALAWLLASSPVVVPIPGASREASATSSAAAAELELSDADLTALAEAFPV
jgi:aryl-alcohol dehydrogenase-like predicted oxidoreductase